MSVTIGITIGKTYRPGIIDEKGSRTRFGGDGGLCDWWGVFEKILQQAERTGP